MATTLIQSENIIPSQKTPLSDSRVNILGLSKNQLQTELEAIGVEPKKLRMRATQIFQWMYHHGVHDFSQMTNIAKGMQAKFAEHFSLDRPEIIERQISVDGTRKYLIRMSPGIEVESVFIPDVSKTGALCVSSQVGCTLTCTFCHTGTQRLVRNLTAREIILQIIVARDDLDEWPTQQENRKLTNIVFMGMGEPLYNTENVCQSIDIMSDETGLSIGRRRVTVSTSGVVPDIGPMGERLSLIHI